MGAQLTGLGGLLGVVVEAVGVGGGVEGGGGGVEDGGGGGGGGGVEDWGGGGGGVEDGGGGGGGVEDGGEDEEGGGGGGGAEELAGGLEEVIKVVGVVAFAVWDPDANTIDPVTTSLMAGTSSEVGLKSAVAAPDVWDPDDAKTSDPVTTSLMAGTSLEEVAEVIGVAAFAVCDDAKMSVVTVSSMAGTSLTTGTLIVWFTYRLVASTPGLAASRDCTETPCSCEICKKESPFWT